MTLTIILILAALMLILGMLEIFVLPGFGIAGIAAAICALVDLVLIYNQYGPLWTLAAFLFIVLLFAALLLIMTKTKTIDKISLKTAIDSTNATNEQLSIKVGDQGKAITRLARVGNAEIQGHIVEVKSQGAFINPGTKIKVIHVSQANITVEAFQPNQDQTD